MLRALYSAASGMNAQQDNLDIISNNLANVNTTGFKSSKIEFQDLLYETQRQAGTDQGSGDQLPTGIQVGHGSQVVATEKVFSQGELSSTGEQLDVAIQGDGFFEVQLPDGTLAYTRDGGFKTNSNGQVVTSNGLPVQGFQAVPQGTTNITISSNGQVSYTTPTGTTTFQIQLARFENEGGLSALGGNLYQETTASGTAELGTPSTNGFGSLAQGYLELSNVQIVKEMVNMIEAQRAYEVNSKAVQAADEMMQMSNNLRR
ncbi:MAG TPA: flagellar basal-body rod protein FlgG [Verrucomicrobiae bacterium]|nr:flagellar basal-body rod protein FlgG [Verrucomicrobiae bacterium]